MFKKSGSCVSKSEVKLRGKELKALRAGLADAFGLDTEALDLVLPAKKGRDVAVRRLGGGTRTELLCLDGVPMLIDPGRPGSKGISVNLCPTLSALWLVPRALPVVQIHPPVSKYVISGSDLMMPGVHSVLPPPGSVSDYTLATGSYVAIAVAGNPMPLAVGKLLFDPLSAGAEGGRLVENLHYYGDALWEASGKVRPNDGFLDQVVAPIGPVEWPEGCTPPGAGAGAEDEGNEEQERADGAAGNEKGETADCVGDQAAAARLERLDGLQKQDGISAANSDDELDALVQQELDSDDELDALVAAELDAEAVGEPAPEPEPEPELDTTGGEWPRTAEDMDEQLETCFLQAARTRLHKKKSLPLDAAVVYAGHMRKVRRIGTDLVSLIRH
jgi:predicted ribosome-associated RNA-binding protein Tma20